MERMSCETLERMSGASGSDLRYEWIVCWRTKKHVKMDMKKNDWSKVSRFRMTLNDTSVSLISAVIHSSMFWTQRGTVSQLWHNLPLLRFTHSAQWPWVECCCPSANTTTHTHNSLQHHDVCRRGREKLCFTTWRRGLQSVWLIYSLTSSSRAPL